MSRNDFDKKLFGEGFFGASLDPIKQGPLGQRFVVPPFSILDTTSGTWRSRKQAWINLGLKGELGRRVDETDDNYAISYRKTLNGFGKGLRKTYKLQEMGLGKYEDHDFDEDQATGTSIFDPVLCELVYKWFSKPGYKVGDPFAGGSTRGIVAKFCGRLYKGVEIREDQIRGNREQAELFGFTPDDPKWVLGDSYNYSNYFEKDSVDILFSCPPYYAREVYSDNCADGSKKQTYEEFLVWYKHIYSQAVDSLKENRFFVIVVGEIRNEKTGEYYNFVGDTITIMKELGLKYWNEMILLNSRGSASLRTNKPFCTTRKVTKVHQNVLVFYKGDLKKMREVFEIPVGEIE
jgi:DNA modification methylase